MNIRSFRRNERRRTARVTFAVPLTVHFETSTGTKATLKTHSQSVNGHGGLILLEEEVSVGQTLLLENQVNGQSAECRVVSVRRGRDSKMYAGIEFLAQDSNFWHMSFLTPGAKPLRRPYSSKLYASV